MNEVVNSGYVCYTHQPQAVAASKSMTGRTICLKEGARNKKSLSLRLVVMKKSTIATGLSYYGQEGMIGAANKSVTIRPCYLTQNQPAGHVHLKIEKISANIKVQE